MRLARIQTAAGPRWADLLDDTTLEWLDGSYATGFVRTGERAAVGGRLLAPVEPTKIVCVGRNYAAHAAEMGGTVPDEPRLFLKATSAIIGPDDAIVLPPRCERIDPEGELGVVIGKRLYRGTPEECMAAVFGYTCVNDVSARDFQKKDVVFGRAKSFDTFCPIGPVVATDVLPGDLALTTAINGEVTASAQTSEMTFDVPALLAFISSIMTLLPGDVVSTGTPAGVAPIRHGDVVCVRIEGIGALTNPVRDRDDRSAAIRA